MDEGKQTGPHILNQKQMGRYRDLVNRLAHIRGIKLKVIINDLALNYTGFEPVR
jgi:hypothetical protein